MATAAERASLPNEYEVAVAIVRALPKNGPIQPTQDDQLNFYAWFKIATPDAVKGARPSGFLDFAGKAKWDAWTKAEDEGVTAPQAREKYVARLKELLKEADDEEAKGYLQELHDAAARA